MSGKVIKVSGPLVVAEGLVDANIADIVRVGEQRLVGEILNITGEGAAIQMYEETLGLGFGAAVETSGAPLSVELGPGLLESVYDGIQRPLTDLREMVGHAITRGIDAPALSRTKRWDFIAVAKVGSKVVEGSLIGTVLESAAVLHKIMVPPGISGRILSISGGDYTVEDVVCVVEREDGTKFDITMLQKWPARVGRKYKKKIMPSKPLHSGQRVIDTMFPIVKGDTAVVAGAFGSGKTLLQRAIAKWAEVDVVVYVGCGARGNEMTDIFTEFSELTDSKSGESLMKRTVLIANTSDMPIASREAAIYTGITIAEYFRDMGYDVALVADSISRWAEALREVALRLGEVPADEGYPAYLTSRMAQFYERAGVVECLGSEDCRGSLTAITAVSPPGGDASELVLQSALRNVKALWDLDLSLAYARHFPAVNPLTSYSLSVDALKSWYDENIGGDFMKNRESALTILREDAGIAEVVRIVGQELFSPNDVLTAATAKMIREDFLQQDAFVDNDGKLPYESQHMLLKLILEYDTLCRAALEKGADIKELLALGAREKIGRAKLVPSAEFAAAYAQIGKEMREQIAEISERGGEL